MSVIIKECAICTKLTNLTCSCKEISYCCKCCQTIDWENHKLQHTIISKKNIQYKLSSTKIDTTCVGDRLYDSMYDHSSGLFYFRSR